MSAFNHVEDEGSENADFDLEIGPLSITSDGAGTECDDATDEETCTSGLGGFSFVLDGEEIIHADELYAQSNSFIDVTPQSNDDGTFQQGLCIMQNANDPCTSVSAVAMPQSLSAVAANTVYDIDIPGVAQGTITVQAEDPASQENGVTGSALTVTMLRIDLDTPDGPVNLDLVRAHSFVGTGTLAPPAAPTIAAQLPNTGGPAASGDNLSGGLIALGGLSLLAAAAFAVTAARRSSGANND